MSWRMAHHVFAAGIPKGQPRARSRPRGRGVYDPGTADGWKGDVQRAMLPHLPPSPLDGLLRVDIAVYLPRPKTFSKLVREAYGGTKKIPAGPVYCPSKPDRDNLDKAVLDALVGMGLIRDDALVVAGSISKYYAGAGVYGGRTGAEISIYYWTPEGGSLAKG